ncbi:MAG: hypothetical protein QGG09_17445, partial [Pirellulaceae bacterium]|nr:hypothetical protein [Pirellulaceae bacterium]
DVTTLKTNGDKECFFFDVQLSVSVCLGGHSLHRTRCGEASRENAVIAQGQLFFEPFRDPRGIAESRDV